MAIIHLQVNFRGNVKRPSSARLLIAARKQLASMDAVQWHGGTTPTRLGRPSGPAETPSNLDPDTDVLSRGSVECSGGLQPKMKNLLDMMQIVVSIATEKGGRGRVTVRQMYANKVKIPVALDR